MKEAAAALAAMLKGERGEIRRIYGNGFVAFGDKVRMRVMLAWPGGDYILVKGYERVVIPLRTGR